MPTVRPCSITSQSRGDDPLEAHPGHEQGGEHGHAARGLAARLVVDPKASVALEAKGLLRLPAPLPERKAPAAWGAAGPLGRNAACVEEGLGLVAREPAIEPGRQPQRG